MVSLIVKERASICRLNLLGLPPNILFHIFSSISARLSLVQHLAFLLVLTWQTFLILALGPKKPTPLRWKWCALCLRPDSLQLGSSCHETTWLYMLKAYLSWSFLLWLLDGSSLRVRALGDFGLTSMLRLRFKALYMAFSPNWHTSRLLLSLLVLHQLTRSSAPPS